MGREANPIPVVNDIDDENYPQDFHYIHENIETSPMSVNRVFTSLQVTRVHFNSACLTVLLNYYFC